MNNRKTPKSQFVLAEDNGVVIASLEDEHDYSFKHTIHSMPHPKVKAPRRSKKQIVEDSQFKAAAFHKSQGEFLKMNIQNMSHDINDHLQEIRKTLKRIQSLTHYVVTAQEVLDEIEKNT